MKKSIFLFLTAFLCFSASHASAQVTSLGNGLTCNGTTILKGSKIVSYSKVKSTLKKTLTALKKSLPLATKSKKKKIQSKISAIKSTQLLITSCNKGQLANGIDPIFNSLVGVYTGTYSGVAVVIPISGAMTLTFDFQPGTTIFEGEIDFGGQIKSALQNKPLTFSGDVAGIAFPAKFVIPNTFLGTVTATVDQDGTFNVTANGVSLNSKLTSKTIAGSLSGSYNGFPFSGSFSASK